MQTTTRGIASESSITVNRPAAGAVVSVSGAAKNLAFDFNPADADFSRVDDGLRISFSDGGAVVLDGFFKTGDNPLPTMSFADETVVESADFLARFDMDLATAAGPAAGQNSAASGGSGEYADNAGSLIDGVDRLSSLAGTDSWSNGAGSSAQAAALTASAALAAAGTEGETGPAPDPSLGYSVRAVLYLHEYAADTTKDVTDYTVAVPFFDRNGEPLTADSLGSVSVNGTTQSVGSGVNDIAVTLPEGWDNQWVTLTFDPASGRLVIAFDPAHAQELQEVFDAGGNLLDYVTVTVSGPDGEFSYNAQIVIETDTVFDSHAQNANTEDGATVSGEIIAEYHAGKGDGDARYVVTGSSGNDEFVFDQTFTGGSSLHASGDGEGNPTGANDANAIYLNKGMKAEAGEANIVDSSAGEIHIGGTDNTDYFWELYNGGMGHWLSLTEGLGAHGEGASNTIQGGDSAVTIETAIGSGSDSTAGLMAVTGENSIVTTDTVSITSEGSYTHGAYAMAGGRNSVEAGDIDIAALGTHGSKGLMTRDGGENILSATGAVTVSAIDQGLAYESIAVHAESGRNTIKANDVAITAAGGDHVLGLLAEQGGENVLTATGRVSVSAEAAGEYGRAYGMLSGELMGGFGDFTEINRNAVEAESINVTVNSQGYAFGVATTGMRESITELSATKEIEITANGDKEAYALYTNGSAEYNPASSIINGGDVTLAATSTTANAGGVTTNGGTAEIHATGDLTVTAQGGDGSNQSYYSSATHGVYAGNNGSNTLTARGDLTVTAKTSGTGVSAIGVEAVSGGSATLSGETVNVSSFADGSSNAGGVAAYAEGEVDISGETVNVSAMSAGSAYAVDANNSSIAVSAADALSITAEGKWAYGVSSSNKADITLTGKDADLTIAATGDYDVRGIDSRSNATVNINGMDIVAISAASSHEEGYRATGVMAGYGGSIAVNDAEEVLITAESVGQHAVGVDVSTAGRVTIEGSDSVTISASVNASSKVDATQIFASAVSIDGKNSEVSISGGDVTLAATSTTANAGGVTTNGGTAEIHATGDLTVTAKTSGTGVSAIGVEAVSGGSATLSGETVNVSSFADGSSNAGGVAAYAEGEVDISGETVNVSAMSAGSAYAVDANNSSIAVSAADALSITAEGKGAYGVSSSNNADITLTGKDADLTIAATGDYDVRGIDSRSNATVNINGMDIVAISAASSHEEGYRATGVMAGYGGSIAVNDAEEVLITAESVGQHAVGVDVSTAGRVTIEGSDSVTISASVNASSKIDAQAQKGEARGVSAESGSAVNVAGGSVTVEAASAEAKAYGVSAVESIVTVAATDAFTVNAQGGTGAEAVYASGAGAEVVINAGDVNITANAGSAYSGGISAEDGAKVSVTAVKDENSAGAVRVVSTSEGNSAYGIYADTAGGGITVKAETVSVEATGGAGAAYGIYGYDNAEISIEANDLDVAVNASGGKRGYGAYAQHANVSLDVANAMAITADSDLWGLTSYAYADGRSSSLDVAAGSISMTSASEDGKDSAGIYAQGSNGGRAEANVNVEGDLSINISNNGNVRGILAANDGSISVSADTLNINLETTAPGEATHRAVGIGAYTEDAETVVTIGSSANISTVATNPDGTVNGHAIAIYNTYGGNVTLQGAQDAETGITVTIYSSDEAMRALGGVNKIVGTEHDDHISITGKVVTYWEGGKNAIETGAGNDVIVFNGYVDCDANSGINNALQINMGAGYDTLVLKATTVDQFISNYNIAWRPWLESTFESMNVEAVHVDLSNEADMAKLQDFFANTADNLFGSANVTYSYGNTLAADNYLNAEGESAFSLGDLLGSYELEGISTIDLAGANANSVLVDLGLLSDSGPLTILGNGDDTVTLTGAESDWQKGESANSDGTYTWTHTDSGSQVNVADEVALQFLSITG